MTDQAVVAAFDALVECRTVANLERVAVTVVAAVRPIVIRECAEAIEAAPEGGYVKSTYACVPDLCPWPESYGKTRPHAEHEQLIWESTDYAAVVRGLAGEDK